MERLCHQYLALEDKARHRAPPPMIPSHPILLAPMNVMAGGKPPASDTAAAAGNAWGRLRIHYLVDVPELLDQVLAKQPAALMLSFARVSHQGARGTPVVALSCDRGRPHAAELMAKKKAPTQASENKVMRLGPGSNIRDECWANRWPDLG
jgi:hypothetical protein